MNESAFRALCAKYGQNHLISHYQALDGNTKNHFLANLDNLDIDLAMNLFQAHSPVCASPEVMRGEIRPAHIVTTPSTKNEMIARDKAKRAGEKLLAGGSVAVLIVAGGQGSRLGFTGPKGTYPISALKGKTLFQLFAEQVYALTKRYGSRIPLIIMTSIENHSDTVRFFQKNAFFGLDQGSIHFFQQGMLPAVTPQGLLVLKDREELFANPDGHGGSLKGLHDSSLLNTLLADGYKELFYCQIDNPLVKIADPVYLGYHTMASAEVSTKVVRRTRVEEKVGVYLDVNGKERVMEYSDIDPRYMSALDEKGDILYWGGNTAIHIFSLPFVKRISDHGFALPYHCAQKKAEINGTHGDAKTIDIWKFETFVFDAIPLAKKTFCMEIAREEEFSPVKNSEGTDTPEIARRAMINLHRKWLEKAGVTILPDVAVEIGPLFALDEEELRDRLQSVPKIIEKETYLG